MQLFSEYVQPVTIWLTNHPHWALLITFLISFSESLAIIGSIVPGSVTMTAIGILAGSGVMRIDLTLLAAILGAIFGDSASYFLGYFYSDRLSNVWPFSKHPKWLAYGKEYFTKHGGKSVLVGRFIGPLRSIIPVVAGMMKMRQDKFIIANIISAIGWSLLYVLPGILIGAASSELSNESATKLFVGVLLALLALWLVGIGLKWLFVHSKQWLERNLHTFWLFAKRHPNLQAIFLWITPPVEKDHAPTCFLIINIFLLFIVLTLLITFQSSHLLISLDQGIYYFFNSIRNVHFDDFFIISALFSSFYITIYFYIIIAVGLILHQQWRTLRYWLSVPLLTILINLFGCQNISQPLLYPVFHLSTCLQQSWLSSLCCSLLLFINYGYKQLHAGLVSIIFLTIVGLGALTHLYFAQLSLTDVLISSFNGMFVALLLWLFYRRKHLPSNNKIKPWVLFYSFIVIVFGIVFCITQFPKLKQKHPLTLNPVVISKQQWLSQKGFAPPRIRRNRWGTPVSYMNLQYVGSIEQLQSHLESSGWHALEIHIFHAFVARLSTSDTWYHLLPFLPQLYSAQPPKLVMVKRFNGDLFVLRLWLSRVRIENSNNHLYYGSVHQSYIEQKQHHVSEQSPIQLIKHELPKEYVTKSIKLIKQKKPTLVKMSNQGLLVELTL